MCAVDTVSLKFFLHFLEFWTRYARPSSMRYAAPTMHEYGEYVDNECVEDHAVEVESADNCWTFYFVTVVAESGDPWGRCRDGSDVLSAEEATANS